MNKPAEISVAFVTDKRIKKLNQKYLGHDCSTDVISFNISENPSELVADIVICTETALRNAKIYKTTPRYEIDLYVAHGLLHLLGYDDRSTGKVKLMRKAETRYVHP